MRIDLMKEALKDLTFELQDFRKEIGTPGIKGVTKSKNHLKRKQALSKFAKCL